MTTQKIVSWPEIFSMAQFYCHSKQQLLRKQTDKILAQCVSSFGWNIENKFEINGRNVSVSVFIFEKCSNIGLKFCQIFLRSIAAHCDKTLCHLRNFRPRYNSLSSRVANCYTAKRGRAERGTALLRASTRTNRT
jgi:hypothetical protein